MCFGFGTGCSPSVNKWVLSPHRWSALTTSATDCIRLRLRQGSSTLKLPHLLCLLNQSNMYPELCWRLFPCESCAFRRLANLRPNADSLAGCTCWASLSANAVRRPLAQSAEAACFPSSVIIIRDLFFHQLFSYNSPTSIIAISNRFFLYPHLHQQPLERTV